MATLHTQMTALTIQIPKEHIFYVRFLLEGYEGLAVQSSQPKSPIVTWLVPDGLVDEAVALLESLEEELGVVVLSRQQAHDSTSGEVAP